MKAPRSLIPLLLVLAALARVGTVDAAASSVAFGPNDVRSVFHVRKSENQNQVHYGLRLDSACRPVGAQPVFGYWRRLKRGVRVDEPLVGAAVRVYGPSDKQEVAERDGSSRVQMYVKALERLPIEIDVSKSASGCRAIATTRLRGVRARLSHAFLQLGALGLRVKYVDVYGERVSDGAKLTERFH